MRILILDDEAVIAQCLRLELRQAGFHDVSRAAKFTDAAEAVLAEPFDLVICDVSLCDGGGRDYGFDEYQFCAYLKDRFGIDHLILSGYDKESFFRESGAIGFLLKPWKQADLLSLVQKCQADRAPSPVRPGGTRAPAHDGLDLFFRKVESTTRSTPPPLNKGPQ